MTTPDDIGTRTVLIIEGRPDVADTLALYLELVGGFRTAVAYDGAAGVEAVLRDHPDAVVCDLGLRKKSGLAVAAELTRRLPDKPLLIAVTAHSDDGIQDRARQAGFDHFLLKPAFPQDIEGLIRDSIPSREAGSRA